MDDKSIPVRRENNFKVIVLFFLIILGLTSFNSNNFLLNPRTELICMPIYNPVENQTFQNCVYWNTTVFIMGYTPISMKNTVLDWLETELQATIQRHSVYRPTLTFRTEISLGIYGSYVLERIANQKVFQVRYISYEPCAIGRCFAHNF